MEQEDALTKPNEQTTTENEPPKSELMKKLPTMDTAAYPSMDAEHQTKISHLFYLSRLERSVTRIAILRYIDVLFPDVEAKVLSRSKESATIEILDDDVAKEICSQWKHKSWRISPEEPKQEEAIKSEEPNTTDLLKSSIEKNRTPVVARRMISSHISLKLRPQHLEEEKELNKYLKTKQNKETEPTS